jgi:hypothetical protein
VIFRVLWLQSALDELAAVWTDADATLRQRITRASHWIDQELQNESLLSKPVCWLMPVAATTREESIGKTCIRERTILAMAA